MPRKGFARIWAALHYSLNGLRYAIAGEAAFRQELFVFIILLAILFFLPVTVMMKCLLFFANTVVLIVELLNSALESIVDMSSPEYHKLAQRAKDLGSAAVFVSLLLTALLWLIAVIHILYEGSLRADIL